MYTRNNDQILLLAGFVGMGMLYYFIYTVTQYLGLDTITGLQTFGLLVVLCVATVLVKILDLEILDNIFYPIFCVGLAICFFPVINDYALKASNPVFFHDYSALSYTSNDAPLSFGPTEITVFWGKWYFKPIYMLIFGLFGYGIQALKNK